MVKISNFQSFLEIPYLDKYNNLKNYLVIFKHSENWGKFVIQDNECISNFFYY